ncbi:hypothetical protein pEaSNUABM50_00540 [Erwinia phage pEa_SNUABM_50]|uniref:Uncharacterized protein n=4 Tax=Eneladusvirus BF TaxID=2560751 RepID=A0A7L8ZPK6_9CAUD|nr:hypothetical protein FDH34_gp404 [Serratia phage BF]QOI71433.1 hypothetical protein pEaSNUABM12_00516 [Erwinia phage pEa_SNUABM_12]QOI71990.1 hypothetical protein pEaSNUABM47_00541 [Erwinia phage pEa_SNUABM_47]QOI72530.1 hypothetical protein pEaSNUABM50_00540 [Erwinia phage pEa_SNUABM_50]QXO12211.1 hypothetical protein pEaSNUABM44_00550 [Erwinia phage pEa_SNUABM_44]AQW89041.1 hypothetical protein BF_0516 [Serratia phage BF]
MAHLDKSKLITSPMDVWEFEYNGRTFYRSSKLRQFLNEMFGSTLVAVFCTDKNPSTIQGLDWSGEDIVTVTANGIVTHLINSEWAHFTKL